jgi:hypothetical protein
MSNQFVFSSNKTSWTTNFEKSIHVDNDQNQYEIALLNLETYNRIPNIDESNNIFVYSVSTNHRLKHKIKIPVGSYDITDINAVIQKTMKQRGHWDRENEKYLITLSANNSTLKCELQLKDFVMVDLTNEKSLANLLGFEKKIYNVGGVTYDSENPVNIISINSIFVNCDIVGGTYLNGKSLPIIYSFFPNVSPGMKVVEKPNHLVFLPVTRTIDQVKIWLTDQNGNLLNLRNEIVTIRLQLRKIIK